MSDKPDDEIDPQPADLLKDSTLNSIDDNSQFKYDDESQRLSCVGSHFDDIPPSIIEEFSYLSTIAQNRLDEEHERYIAT
ncbi:unnamed protein product [Rotaria socialis]|uniref:Uncharacterized protein n=1 Tax=Rotaria socialis TaxID=392032 RepID=A0A818D8Y0_9BILA|nr:unnamed protein product [Rotaria socialis]CAF3443773.1 unnamed protein product [Rotaria socialis]CAF4405601.1 unnamed protein product [Rotaria socialis]CAF4500386.1 unnamed protein product [Rotaria socialis]